MKLDRQSMMRSLTLVAAFGASFLSWQTGSAQVPAAQVTPAQPDFPPFEKVTEGFVKSDSKSPDKQSLCGIWTREKDGQMLLELPKDFAMKKYFIALTVSSGDRFAGLQSNDFYVYWRQYNKRLALIVPNMDIRSNGEPESKSSVKRLFTDTVLLDVPIITMGPRGGGPVIDADALFVGNAAKFFGPRVRVIDPQLIKIVKAKSFSKNAEMAFEVVAAGGKLQTLHFSYSEVPEENGYRPRKADQRVGYFLTNYSDLGSYDDDKKLVRYVTRWRLEKRDPSLKISPPVKPIRFYIEHTTPVRYRRWVKQGIEYWNKAFEQIGFSDAVEVFYQDAKTGDNMDLDPEDVQYNFVRWLNNDIGTAIGPSRVHPLTGEILDADIILTDGWIRHFNFQYHDMMPDLAMEGMSAETVSWLGSHPSWDPRLRLAPNANRDHLKSYFANQSKLPYGGHPITKVDASLIGDQPFDGLIGRTSQVNGYCAAASGKQMDMSMARLGFDLFDDEGNLPQSDAKKEEPKQDEPKKDEPKKEEPKVEEKKPEDKKPEEKKPEVKKPEKVKESLLDGMPEAFIGPLLAELVAHEAGHTLGLRHNFKASSVYTLKEINSEAVKGKKTLASSVMDYLPINIPYEVEGATRGDWTMTGIGPYDYWAIEYGYTPEEAKLQEILKRVSEPELQYATDEDTGGPDPLARRYDYSKDPLDYAENQIRLVKLYRSRLLDKFVKDGDSWGKARRGYELTLGEQMKCVSMMANWIGGATVNRDKKGDPGNRQSLIPVSAERQRKALDFVFRNAFRDGAFGITQAILERLTNDKWIDEGMRSMGESTFPVHDRVLGYQAATLTMLMNPSTLRRVFDNESLVPADQDAVTLPELMDKLYAEIWSELDTKPEGEISSRKPRISSWRRNLQREHLERLIDLAMPTDSNAVTKPVTALALMQLKELKRKLDATLEGRNSLDSYTLSHLGECQTRIVKAIDAIYVYNMPSSFGGGGGMFIILGQDGKPVESKEVLEPDMP
ncbi:MAG TPA: zinc-dependent metalloprotease [Pirellula sp.]|nr:zinc-dependent metalloprotease [Pirellula sp.]